MCGRRWRRYYDLKNEGGNVIITRRVKKNRAQSLDKGEQIISPNPAELTRELTGTLMTDD
jgi:hypothetical protein